MWPVNIMIPKTSVAVVLVDGSYYLFRAYHALPRLTNSQDFPTGAVKGIISMIRSLCRDYAKAKIIIVFDAKGKNFRHDLYSAYKGNRPPMPTELQLQIEPIQTMIRAMGLPLLVIPDVEADDVIGTLSQQASSRGLTTQIATGDKDMAQLVNPHVSLINTMTNTYLDQAGVMRKFDVPANQIIDYLAIMGDKVDNIPGVPGAGPKTAAKWLQHYGSLVSLIKNADDVSGKIGVNLRQVLPTLMRSQALATIKLDVALPRQLVDMIPQAEDQATLLHWYDQLEFSRWSQLLRQTIASQGLDNELTPVTGIAEPLQQQEKIHYTHALTQAEVLEWLARCRQASMFALDTETTSLDYMAAELVGVALSCQTGEAVYIPCGHDYPGAPQQVDRVWLLSVLKPLLEDPVQTICGQNLKYDMHILARYGIKWQARIVDSMMLSYVLNATATRHNLADLAKYYLHQSTIKFETLAGKGAKQLTFNQIDLQQATPYAAEDADISLRLTHELTKKIIREPALEQVYRELEQPLIPLLVKLERNGVCIDAALLSQQSTTISHRLQRLEQTVHDLTGEAFNLSSTKQLGAILYGKLKLPVLKKTPKGQPSTAESVLQELAKDYELPRLLLEFRSLSKLKSTYTDKLPQQINLTSGRVHTSYHQAVTATGRLSSSDPNLQNIPIRSAEGRLIRQAFVAPQGACLVAADYSQIELRLMAHLSRDTGLMSAFAAGQDVHLATAAEVFDVAPEQISVNQRRSAKAINFGLIYGMSAFGLARQLNISRQQSQAYINRYFSRYPGVQAYMDHTRELAAAQGYVTTIFGRRLYLADIQARNAMTRQAAERTAINAPMQGSAADIIKRAMLAVDDWLQQQRLDARMIMQVHDELVFEVSRAQVDQFMAGVTQVMSGAAELAVPLLVDVGFGDNWDEAH